jgi:hypothetical protein
MKPAPDRARNFQAWPGPTLKRERLTSVEMLEKRLKESILWNHLGPKFTYKTELGQIKDCNYDLTWFQKTLKPKIFTRNTQ